MSRKFLYRRIGCAVIVILAMLAAMAPPIAAQGKPQLKRPLEAPEEKPVESKKKKVKGPRAVGILQFGTGGKSTLVPVAILVDGKFYDASVYKAEPVPMALEGGTVYEAEEAGESEGLFTINGALHSKFPGSASPWTGTGSYLAHGTEAPKSTQKAEDVPVGLGASGDEPPRLTRNTKPAAAPPSSTQAGSESSGKAGVPSSPGSTQSSPAPAQAGGSTAGGSSGQDTAKGETASTPDKGADQSTKEHKPPTQKAGDGSQGDRGGADQKGEGQGSGEKIQPQSSENYYRPTLRRGKPTEAAPEEEETAAKLDRGGSPSGGTSAASMVPLRIVAAISDAGGPDPQSYKFFWKEGEEDERRKQMLALAGDEVRAYIAARAKGAIPAKPPAKTGDFNRKSIAKPAEPQFENLQFRAFDVWRNNQPVMILTAQAHLQPMPGTSVTPETYSITLVTRTDIYGNVRKLYSGVTDKFHLDVTPRLELIDVVDADGDGRGELLFRETTDAGNGYVIYRATGDKLWKMFDSLGGE
jgi:hypothetical protein